MLWGNWLVTAFSARAGAGKLSVAHCSKLGCDPFRVGMIHRYTSGCYSTSAAFLRSVVHQRCKSILTSLLRRPVSQFQLAEISRPYRQASAPAMFGIMDKKSLRAQRKTLEAALASYESGKVTHYDEDERGERSRETTGEHVESLRQRIAEIDRKLADPDRD